ncbi:dual specificity protein phosphatase family protein [Candidatus Woesebacteria bacterium]|nr:dual specificity protein phosphatase family protein [Candidatus Woesebacteria bacterium]
MYKITSLIQVFKVHFLRACDHIYRRYTGLPLLKYSEITPQLYLGGQYYSHALKNIQNIGITGIVSMRERSIKELEGFEGIKKLHLSTRDLSAPSLENLQKGILFIQKELDAGGKVYVHCHLGEGRGPSMAIAYLMSTGLLYEDAFSLVKSVRPFIRPTKPQVARLKELEKLQQQRIA